MRQTWMNWTRRLWRFGGLASVALIPRVVQAAPPPPPPPPSNLGAIILIIIAVLGPIALGLGLAFVVWLISLGTPPAAVGAEPPKPARPREVLPPGVHLPPPSIRPLVIAMGLMFTAFGFVTRDIAIFLSDSFRIPIILVLGLLLFVIGLFGWLFDDWRAAHR